MMTAPLFRPSEPPPTALPDDVQPTAHAVAPGVARRLRRLSRRFHDPRDRAIVLGMFAVVFVLLRLFTALVWDEGRAPETGTERLFLLGMWGWITTVPSVLAGIIAWIVPRRSRPRRGQLSIDTEVSFRVVSRGLNPEALQETVYAVRAAMEARPLFPYRIDVVTDTPVELPTGDDVVPLVVPADYEPENGSKFKARALHWALTGSDLPAEAWVVHLDEESHPTAGVIGGIRDFIVDAEEAGDAPVGQGTILYYRHLMKRPILTLADSLRTGDDISRFFAQYRMGKALFGMHGSFIVVRNDVAQGTGFDVGPDGSITEDAWWALQLLERGHRFAWVDGHIVEQAPENITDFVRQRRRWFSGLVKVALYAPAPWWATATMLTFLSLWAGATLGVLYTWLNLFMGLRTPTWLALIGAACYAWYVTLYVTGLRLNLAYHERDLGALTRRRKALLYTAQVVCMPLFAAMETAGVIYALVKPERGFHVIRKSASGPIEGTLATSTAPVVAPPAVAIPASSTVPASIPSAEPWTAPEGDETLAPVEPDVWQMPLEPLLVPAATAQDASDADASNAHASSAGATDADDADASAADADSDASDTGIEPAWLRAALTPPSSPPPLAPSDDAPEPLFGHGAGVVRLRFGDEHHGPDGRRSDRRSGRDRRRRSGLRSVQSGRMIISRAVPGGVELYGAPLPDDADLRALLRALTMAGGESRTLGELAAEAFGHRARTARTAAAAERLRGVIGDSLVSSERGDRLWLGARVLVERRIGPRRDPSSGRASPTTVDGGQDEDRASAS